MGYTNSFFDTVGGRDFVDLTVPALVDSVKELNSNIRDLNEIMSKLLEELTKEYK